ncbi:MAG: hypothetical protein H3C34_07065 [Caldilineaceae bacterium]|nr:hypothetical protein [Caldilineaceae bacterium]
MTGVEEVQGNTAQPAGRSHCPEEIWGDDLPPVLDMFDLEAPDTDLPYTVCDCCQQWDYCYTMLVDKDGLPVGQRSFCRTCWSRYTRNES